MSTNIQDSKHHFFVMPDVADTLEPMHFYGYVDTSKIKHKKRSATSKYITLDLLCIKVRCYGVDMKLWQVSKSTDELHNGEYTFKSLFRDSSYSNASRVFEALKNIYKLVEE